MGYKIAIVGRPNVGKSTLFNRLTGVKKAIVHDMPGVTRDRLYGHGSIADLNFELIDTPGLEEAEDSTLQYRMMLQTDSGISESNAVLFVVDGRAGINQNDIFFANRLRKSSAKVILVINKCEKAFVPDNEFFRLGFKEMVPISAEHGLGMGDLYDALKAVINFEVNDDESSEEDPKDVVRIAVVGRPNSGKSTFINSLLGEERLLTGPEAGITRDAIDSDFNYKGKAVKIIDTAGLRKKSNIYSSLEKLSTGESIKTLKFANVVVLMVDATMPLEKQDLTIASVIYEEGRAIVIAINKIDLIKDKQMFSKSIKDDLELTLPQARGVKVIYLSALKSQNTSEVLDACLDAYEKWQIRIPTFKLNQWLEDAINSHYLPLAPSGKRVRIKYATQIKTRPITIKFFANYPELIAESYKKYLLNSFRDTFDIPGVPIRTTFAKGKNPYSES